MKLTGDPHPLDRLVSVQPNTVVVVFEQDSAPRLKFPGEYLTPGLLPSLRPVQVLAVNTAPVELDVTVDHLLTLDGHEIERCLVRVTVQLTDRDKYASVAGLQSTGPSSRPTCCSGSKPRWRWRCMPPSR